MATLVIRSVKNELEYVTYSQLSESQSLIPSEIPQGESFIVERSHTSIIPEVY